jgi:hypothetical protein
MADTHLEHRSPDPGDHDRSRPGSNAGKPLVVRVEIRLFSNAAGRALAAAQATALADLLACLGETEVGQDEEVLP